MATETRIVTPADLAETLQRIGQAVRARSLPPEDIARWINSVQDVILMLKTDLKIEILLPSETSVSIDYLSCRPKSGM